MPQLLIHRGFLALCSVLVTCLSVYFISAQMYEVLTSPHERHIEIILSQEETLALILVGFGAILEGREVMARWVAGGKELAAADEGLNETAEYYGFMILTIGLFIEIVDQLLSFVESSHRAVALLEFGVNYPLNLYALLLLAAVSYRLLSGTTPKRA